MADSKKNSPEDDIMASLLKELGEVAPSEDSENALDFEAADNSGDLLGLVDLNSSQEHGFSLVSDQFDLDEKDGYEKTTAQEDSAKENIYKTENEELLNLDVDANASANELSLFGDESLDSDKVKSLFDDAPSANHSVDSKDLSESTVALDENPISDLEFKIPEQQESNHRAEMSFGDSEKTIAVTGYQIKPDLGNYDDKVKVSVGQNRSTAFSPGYASWGSSDSNLAQAENLHIAQDKILELERENEKLRQQNEELIAASEIIKERSDLLTAQITEYKNDRDGLEESFKNEMTLLKSHITKKDAELQRSQIKVDELESRLKFDMKKIRIRERELENRLELVRAEKNAIVKNKDEQILDLRRKMDILQMEVESYRQKCVEMNKLVETNQESFKRTTRALRLAMANLELQDENKAPLKKVD